MEDSDPPVVVVEGQVMRVLIVLRQEVTVRRHVEMALHAMVGHLAMTGRLPDGGGKLCLMTATSISLLVAKVLDR